MTLIGIGDSIEVATRRYSVADIASVSWEKRGAVFLKLSAGSFAKLPELGYNSQGLTTLCARG